MPTHFTEGDFEQNFPTSEDVFPNAQDNENFLDAIFLNSLAGSLLAVEGYLITHKGTIEEVEQNSFTGAEGSLSFAVPAGWYGSGKTATAQDSDLVAANIKKDVVVFGVTGSLASGGFGADSISLQALGAIEETPESIGPTTLTIDTDTPAISTPTLV